jgi:phage-related protein
MSEQLTSAAIGQLNKLAQPIPYVFLCELHVPTDPVTLFRLNNSTHPVVFGVDDEGTPLTYYPFNFEVAGLRRSADGAQFNMVVTFTNVTRELQVAVENYDGLLGQDARVMLVNRALLQQPAPMLEVLGEIINYHTTAETISFEIGRQNLYGTNFPSLRISPVHCWHKYGGPGCGYDTTAPGALQTCSKLQEGPDGCREHGDAEVAAGLDRRHPARIGLFRGIARGGKTGL